MSLKRPEVVEDLALRPATEDEEDRAVGLGGVAASGRRPFERDAGLAPLHQIEMQQVHLARGGEIKTVESAEALRAEIDGFVARFARTTVTRSALSRIRGSWREALLALGLAVGLWYVAIPGGALETVDRRVPIVVENLPEGYRLVSVSPSDVAVRFEGRRRDLYLASATDLAVEVDALLVQLGRRTFSLSLDQVRSPEEVRPVSIEPARIKLSVMQD